MADTAKRFAATRGQNGTAMGKLSDAMKDVAVVIDKWWDSSEPGVQGAIQHFEQGLAKLKMAAPEGFVSDDEDEPKKPARKPAPKNVDGESAEETPAATS
jgi:hypothetical protein